MGKLIFTTFCLFILFGCSKNEADQKNCRTDYNYNIL